MTTARLVRVLGRPELRLTESMVELLREAHRRGQVSTSPATGRVAAALVERGLAKWVRAGQFLFRLATTDAGEELLVELDRQKGHQ